MMKWNNFEVDWVIHRKMFAIDFELVDSIKQMKTVAHLTLK